MCHIFFIHSSVDGHLGCFHVLAIVNREQPFLNLFSRGEIQGNGGDEWDIFFSQEGSFPPLVEVEQSLDRPLSISKAMWLPQGPPPVWENRKALGRLLIPAPCAPDFNHHVFLS